MAIAVANKTSGGSNTGATSYNTASVSVVAGRLYLLTVRSDSGAATVANTPTVSGAGQTWTQVGTQLNSANNRRRVTMFRAMPGANNSGALTISFGGQTQQNVDWIVDEITGVSTTGTNGANAIVQTVVGEDTGTGTSFSLTLAAFVRASNGVYAAVNVPAAAAPINNEAGYTETAESNVGTTGNLEAEFKATSDTTPSWTYAGSVGTFGAIAVELQEAQVFTPTTRNVGLTLFAPTVTAPIYPTTAALTLTTFAPSISVGQRSEPAPAALTLTTFAPEVTVAEPVVVFPSVECRVAWRPEQFNKITNPGFETNTAGWSVSAGINGAATSITRITTDAHGGSASGQLVCPATALTGVNFDFGAQSFFAASTYLSVYRFVVWLKAVSGTTFARLIVGSEGTSSDRASRDVVIDSTWQAFYLDWAPSATRTDVQLAIINVPAVAMTVKIDDVAVYLRDAHTQVENGYFVTNTAGWSVSAGINAAATSITRQSSGGFFKEPSDSAAASGRLVTTSTDGSGANFDLGTAKYSSGRTYRLRAYMKSISGTTSARLRLGSLGTAADRADATVTLTTDWAAYEIEWTPSADRTDVELAISNGAAAAMTVDIDGVEVFESIDDISDDAFGENGAVNLQFGRGASFDGAGQAAGFANVTVVNATGKYTPDNASSVLYGMLEDGRRVLIRATYSGAPYPIFYGLIERLVPQSMSYRCEIMCLDTIESLSRMSVRLEETARSYKSARAAALDYNVIPNYSAGNGPIENSYAWLGTDEVPLLQYLEALNTATGSLHFVRPSVYASVGWRLVSVDRTVHSDASSTSETWDDDLSDFAGYDVTREALVNRQRVDTTPFESNTPRDFVDLAAADADQWGGPEFDGGKVLAPMPGVAVTTSAELPYTVPANEERVQIFDFGARVTDVAIGGFAGLSQELQIGSRRVVLIERAAGADVTRDSLSVTGKPLIEQPVNDRDRKDEESIALRGERQGNAISSPYINHPALGDGLGDWRIWRHRTARARPTATKHDRFASQLAREVADRITLNYARLSLSGKAFAILSHSTRVSQNARDWQTSYTLEVLPSAPAGGWFVIGSSAWDSDDQFAY